MLFLAWHCSCPQNVTRHDVGFTAEGGGPWPREAQGRLPMSWPRTCPSEDLWKANVSCIGTFGTASTQYNMHTLKRILSAHSTTPILMYLLSSLPSSLTSFLYFPN